jgi:signal transduction histidine kinase
MAHLDCQTFFNFLVDETVGRLHLNAFAGIPEEEAKKIEWLDYGVAVCGCAARDSCRIVAEHIPSTPDVRTELVKSYGVKAHACHPLLGPGQKVIGTLSFGTKNRETFTAEDLSLMKAVADQVAVAMERMSFIEKLERSRDELENRVRERTALLQKSEERLNALSSELIIAQETERKRVAHELHDGLAAQLAAVKYKVEQRFKRGESLGSTITLEETVKDIDTAIMETRRIMANLRPSVLDDLGILPALSWYLREIGKAYPGTSAEYSGNVQESDVPEGLKIVLFRVVQESITNAVRHGNSSLIKVGLEKESNWLRLRVEDNGDGFEFIKKSTSGGIGLDSMQQRVESTGGIFSISSSPGNGTTVKAEWRID